MSEDLLERDGADTFDQISRIVRVTPDKKIKLRGPAIILIDPKYDHNVGQAWRMCSCYGIKTLVMMGRRVKVGPERTERLPREERMRGYSDVTLYVADRPFDLFEDSTFVAVEVRENAEKLPHFQHPPNPVYVFGPEDGSLGRVTLQQCQRFVVIPSRHCLNLAAAVGTVLYDKIAKEFV